VIKSRYPLEGYPPGAPNNPPEHNRSQRRGDAQRAEGEGGLG